jgi:D-arabinitol dehydrogenase (NADP+)
MRAIVYNAPRTFALRDIPTPVPGPGEVRVKVLQVGLCGTDLHLHNGRFLASFPFIPGHEVVGHVDELGPGVTGLPSGELVTVNPNSSCSACSQCRDGRPLLCPNLTGIGSNKPGGFADYLVAPVSQIFSVEGMGPDVAVFTEPTSCVMHGIDVLRPAPGTNALVFGAGPTGLIMAQLIARHGGAHVTVAASTQFKLDAALRLGIDRVHRMNRANLDHDVEQLLLASGGEGYDIVVEATGAATIAEMCVPLTRSGGTVLIYGVTDEDDRISVSPYEIFRRELTIKGSFAEIDSFPQALAALRSGKVLTDGMITHRFGLENYGDALEAQRTDPTRHKIVIGP